MSKGGRTLKQIRNDYRMTDKIPLKSLKNVSGNIDVAGYAEMQYVNGAWRFTEGMLGLDANIGYKYNGNTVVYVVPVTYSFSGSVGAGIDGVLTNLDVNNFTPQIEGYINARISGTIGGGIGISCLNVCHTSGTATLNMKKALTNEYLKTWVDENLLY